MVKLIQFQYSLMGFVFSAGAAVQSLVSPVTPTGVVLRRASSSSPADSQKRMSSDSISSPVPQSPHRVSWVEDKLWMNPPAPSSLLQPPCIEFDSLSMSSIDEEPDTEPAISPSQVQNSPRLPLADKVKNRISAVGQALGGFMNPQKRLSKRVQEMSERKGSSFAEALRGFVEQTLKTRAGCAATSTVILQEVRSSLTALRETLYESAEIQSIIESMGDVPDFELGKITRAFSAHLLRQYRKYHNHATKILWFSVHHRISTLLQTSSNTAVQPSPNHS